MYRPRTYFVLAFVAYIVVIRLLPKLLPLAGVDISSDQMAYPWNFVPLTVLCLYAGAHFRSRAAIFLCPLLVRLVSDVSIGLIGGGLASVFYTGMPMVYGSLALCAALGILLRKDRSAGRIGGTALAAALVFFLLTNLASWWTMGLYSHDLAGLSTCFTMALPFFRNSLIAMAVFTPIAFSSLAVFTVPEPVPVYVAAASHRSNQS